VHRIPAIKVHAVRHPRGIEMCSARSWVFTYVDIRHDHIAFVTHVIAKLARVMVLVFGTDGIIALRRGETGLTRGKRLIRPPEFYLCKSKLSARSGEPQSGMDHVRRHRSTSRMVLAELRLLVGTGTAFLHNRRGKEQLLLQFRSRESGKTSWSPSLMIYSLPTPVIGP
jgi:hypothetical protein